jgi:hypothetical protein
MDNNIERTEQALENYLSELVEKDENYFDDHLEFIEEVIDDAEDCGASIYYWADEKCYAVYWGQYTRTFTDYCNLEIFINSGDLLKYLTNQKYLVDNATTKKFREKEEK